MPRDPIGTHFFRLPIDSGILWHFKIFDEFAFLAYKMTMRSNFSFKPVIGAAKKAVSEYALGLPALSSCDRPFQDSNQLVSP